MYFRELDFYELCCFFSGILIGWAVLSVKVILTERLQHLQKKDARDYRGPSGESEEDWWQRFKDWCSRNKIYIGLGIFATIAVTLAIVVYSNGATAPTQTSSEWSYAVVDLCNSLDFHNAKTAAQVGSELMAGSTFFSDNITTRMLAPEDVLEKEGHFLKQILTISDYYEVNPASSQWTLKHLETLLKFLHRELNVYHPGCQEKFYDHLAVNEYLGYYESYLNNFDDAPAAFKTLVYFLIQSEDPGDHQLLRESFNEVRVGFLTDVTTNS